jgi:threonylcarbamoyladenosine tRNA methylthiotransferase MtaB
MGRGYTIDEHENVIKMIRDSIPDIAITTDIIVGFPGETEAEFEESYRFCEKVGYANIHVFPYSTRTGTAAAQMKNKIPDKIKKARSRMMLDLARQSSQRFRERFQGETMPVLWEEQKRNRNWVGYTGNYISVYTKSDESLINCLVNTKLGREHDQGLWGEIPTLSNPASLLTKGE